MVGINERSLLSKLRNAEIVRVCMALAEKRYEEGKPAVMTAIAKEASKHSSSRFWVSEERASIVVCAWEAHEKDGTPYPYYADPETMTHHHREMFKEIYSRYKLLRSKYSKLSRMDAITRVVHSPAPSFYVTEQSILIYFYTHRKHAKKSIK